MWQQGGWERGGGNLTHMFGEKLKLATDFLGLLHVSLGKTAAGNVTGKVCNMRRDTQVHVTGGKETMKAHTY